MQKTFVSSDVDGGGRDETDQLQRTATGGEASGMGKRKREIDDGEQKFTGKVYLFEPPKRTTPEELKNYSILQDCEAVVGDPLRQRWLNKCIYAVQETLPDNEKDNHDICEPTFIRHLLASFETFTFQELRFDLDKYNAIMEQLSSNIKKFNPLSPDSNVPEKKLSLTQEMNEKETKRLREWVLLDRCGYVHDRKDGSLHFTATRVTSCGVRFKVSLCAQEPPNVSQLRFMADVPDNILSSKVTDDFLFRSRPVEFNVLVMSSHEKTILLEVSCAGKDYFVMDLMPLALTRLPPPCLSIHCGIGIMRCTDSYVVAALEQPVAKAWHISFLSSSTNAWSRKQARVAPELDDWFYWEITAVLVCNGRFWWLDLRRGLLSCSCDSLLEENHGTEQLIPLEFTVLPNISMEEAKQARMSKYSLLRDRSVAVSDGRLRYVDVRAQPHHLSRAAAAPPLCDFCRGGSVTTWTLDYSSGAWFEDHVVRFANVWKDKSYGYMLLPKEAPQFPLVDPLDGDVFYFSIMEGDEGNRCFGVNLRTRKITSCSLTYKRLDSSFYPLEPVITGVTPQALASD